MFNPYLTHTNIDVKMHIHPFNQPNMMISTTPTIAYGCPLDAIGLENEKYA